MLFRSLSTFSSFLILCSGESLTYVSSFIILYSGESLTCFHRNKRADFSGEISTMKLSGMSIFVKYKNRGRPCPRIYRSIFTYKADTTVTVMSIHNL